MFLDWGFPERSARKFMSLMPDINMRNKFTGYTPLHWAVACDNKNIIPILLEAGADINCRNQLTGDTPLHVAAAGGYLDIIKILLSNGAKITFKNYARNLPLDTAIQEGVGKQNNLS